MKVRVPIAGTVGKAVFFDPEAGARAEAAVAALAAQISAGIGGNILHASLQNLRVGDDHPQYTGWQFPETIVGQWNFQTIPQIQGETLAEYIQDVVGADFFDFLQDTSSVVWTYRETANELEANVPPEFVQDVIGGSLTTTASVALSYNDGAGTFAADVIPEFIQDTVGAMLANTSSITLAYNDGAGTFSASIVDEYVQDVVAAFIDNSDTILWDYNDSTNNLLAIVNEAAPYTWTGVHAWTGVLGTVTIQGDSPYITINGSGPHFDWFDSAAAADTRLWREYAFMGVRTFDVCLDNSTGGRAWLTVTRSTNSITDISFGNATNNPAYQFLGTGTLSGAVAAAWSGLHTYTPATGRAIVINQANDVGILLQKTGGASLPAFMQFTGTNSGSTSRTYYNGVNVFATDGSFEIKDASGVGVQLLPVVGTLITQVSATGGAGLRLPHGAAPSSPTNGDMWTTTAGLFVRINGATVGPLT